MWKGRFEADTAQVVLKFTQSLDLDWQLYEHDIQGSIAHARTLAAAGLLTAEEMERIEDGLNRICQEIRGGELKPSERLEDVHMNVESRLIELLGPVGAKLHTGRSRNDQIAVTMRLYLRDRLLGLQRGLLLLLETLLGRAERHQGLIISGYTHLQQAQPISLGHYWMAWFEAFSRDSGRLDAALASLDECPLGAGALAGSTLPLDRETTSKLLGFARPTRNSLDTVAQRDYMADYHHFASLFAVHAGRLAEDLILYATQEFGWLRLPDSFCTGSSIMPQKKNPDVLELVRGKTGQVLGHMLDLLVMMKGLPMTYDRDLQEDKRGLFASVETVEGVLEVLSPLLANTEADQAAARSGLEKGLGLALATDVAEYLVVKGVPFRDAHWKVGRLVKHCLENNKPLTELTLAEWQEHIPETQADILDILSLDESVARRKTYGGTAFEQVAFQIEEGKERLLAKTKTLEAELKRVKGFGLQKDPTQG
ncbi:MAG: argininosuccinate lyase [Synergistaceae bacterium]|jgi:argininosuccinate lyase|nr:argininosuccinate lyase [Synergistaceae bacterium]